MALHLDQPAGPKVGGVKPSNPGHAQPKPARKPVKR